METIFKIVKVFVTVNLLTLLFLVSGCGNQETETAEIKQRAQVQVVNPSIEDLKVQQKFFATSIYLKRNVITAPIPGFITKVHIKLGKRVKEGEVLYEMETKERRALKGQSMKLNGIPNNFGYISIKAPADGIISTFDKQQTGDYVLEGTQLATIAESKQLAFQLNLPYEYNEVLKQHPNCEIQLPDSTILEGEMVAPLATMNLLSQTQPYLIKPLESTFLPENMIVTVRLTIKENKSAQTLPTSSVLSDVLMKDFWVMKLINDSIAVGVNVQPGIRENNKVEIISPAFKPSDRILSEGNYGLSDTALVKIIK